MSQSETGCLTLIAVESVGWGQSWTRTPLTLQNFAQHSNTLPRTCQDSLTEIEGDGLIERRKAATGRGFEYRRKQRIDFAGQEGLGHCPECKKPTQFTLDRDVTIPHSLFLKVQAAVDHGTFLCLLMISLECFQWREGQIWVYPKEIRIDEFRRRTGLSKSEVEADLAKAESLGFIGSSGKRGAIQTFWPMPNTWPTAIVRRARQGGNPSPGKRKNTEGSKLTTVEPKEGTPKTSPVEFLSRPCGKCHECQYWGPVDILPESANALKKPIATARAGPPSEVFSSFPKFKGF